MTTLYNDSGFGFKIIHASKLNKVLSTKEDKIVDRLFLSHKNFELVAYHIN